MRPGARRALLAALTLVLSLGCVLAAQATSSSVTTTVALGERSYVLHQQRAGSGPAPLLVVLHGLNGDARHLAVTTGWDAVADAQGFTVVYPQATTSASGHAAWNSGGCCQGADVDDVAALKAVVADVQTRAAVDPSRVYVVGFSNGDMMAWRLVCEAGDVFAAGGGAAGVLDPGGEFSCPDPVRFRELHGGGDGTVPRQGGPSQFRPGAFPSWAGEDPGHGTAAGSNVSRLEDLPCGHAWPRLDNDCRYDGSADLWAFLSAQRLVAPAVAAAPAAGTYSRPVTVVLTPSRRATVRWTVDGTAPGPASPVYTGPITLSQTATLRYAAVDSLGRTSDAEEQMYRIGDTTAPTAPGAPVAGPVDARSVALTWTPSTDDTGVTGYTVYRDDEVVGRPTEPGLVDDTVAAGSSYCYRVVARDAAGNTSPSSPGTTVTVAESPVAPEPLDRTPPTSPGAPSATSTTTSTVTLAWAPATDDTAVTGYDVLRDGVAVGSARSPSFTDTGLSPDTSHTYAVVARDAAGNTSAAGPEVVVRTRPAPPLPAVAAPVAGLPAGTRLAAAGAAARVPVRLSWSSAPGAAGYAVQRSTDGGPFAPMGLVPAAATGTTVRLAPGAHRYRFRIRARDAAGQVGAWAVGSSFGVQLVQEQAGVYAGAWTTATAASSSAGHTRRSATAGSTVSFRFSGTAFAWVAPRSLGAGSVELSVDGGPPTTVDLRSVSASARRLVAARSGLSAGPHTVVLRLPGVPGTAVRPVDVDALATLG